MKSVLSISKKALDKNNISIGEVLYLIMLQNNVDLEEADKLLVEKGFISTEYDEEYQPKGRFVTNKGNDMLAKVMLDSDEKTGSDEVDERVNKLVPLLQEIYPAGKNFNNQYWRGNKSDIALKLKKFFQKYGSYTDEQILNATRSYVQGFNGSYKFMRLLQHFIWKEEVKDGSKVRISELANYLENQGQTDDFKEDWTSSLV